MSLLAPKQSVRNQSSCSEADRAEQPAEDLIYVSDVTATRRHGMTGEPPSGLKDGDTFTDAAGLKWTARQLPTEDPLPFDAITKIDEALDALHPAALQIPAIAAIADVARLSSQLARRCANEAKKARERGEMYLDVLQKTIGPPRDRGALGRVYFIQSTSPERLIKIGFSTYPKGRLKALQTSSGHALVLLHSESGTKQDEHALHKRFSMCRAEGEWFRPTKALLEHIQTRKAA